MHTYYYIINLTTVLGSADGEITNLDKQGHRRNISTEAAMHPHILLAQLDHGLGFGRW